MKVDAPMGTCLFGEKQQFPRWLLLLVIGPVLFVVVILLVQVSIHKVPLSQYGVALAVLVPLTVFLVCYFPVAPLKKVVSSNGFYYRWTPFQKRCQYIEKERIGRVLRWKAPLGHYGFGFFFCYGWVHHINRAEVLQVYLQSGQKLFFGTSDGVVFEKAMTELISTTSKYERCEY